MSLADDFLKMKSFAVVGASQDRGKYGFKVYRTLKQQDYEVYPINPNAHNIMGDTCYKSLTALGKKPDVVCIILEPEKGKTVIEECKDLGLSRVWLQPGAESPSLLKLCEEYGIQAVSGVCIMVESPAS